MYFFFVRGMIGIKKGLLLDTLTFYADQTSFIIITQKIRSLCNDDDEGCLLACCARELVSKKIWSLLYVGSIQALCQQLELDVVVLLKKGLLKRFSGTTFRVWACVQQRMWAVLRTALERVLYTLARKRGRKSCSFEKL